MSKPIRTFIYGSCVSRDTIAAARPGEFEIVGYVARQSLISMARNAIDAWPEGFRLESNFQQRVVEGDWWGNAGWLLTQKKDDLDLVLLDLTDERFGVYRRDDQSVITRSIDMMGTPLEQAAQEFEFLLFGSEPHLELFKSAATEFAGRLKEQGLFEKAVVVRVPWASETEDRQPTPASLDLTAECANEIFPQYYAVLDELGFRFIDVPNEQVYAYSSHHWGVAAFHYTPAIYESILDQLRGEHPADVGTSVASSEDETPQALRKDYARISALHTRWASVDEFLAADQHVNGVHTVQMGETTVELYLQGQPLQCDQNVIPIFFSGAVTDRANKQPPFFSGYGIAKEVGTPFISISDPLVDAHEGVGIAWYTGRLGVHLQGHLAHFFSALHRRYGKELLMVGGSAGGFAALYYAMRIGKGASVFAWNPQTDVTRYRKPAVEKYLVAAGFSDRAVDGPTWKSEAIREATAKLSLWLPSSDAIVQTKRALIIQNQSDWHMEEHLAPWIKGGDWKYKEAEDAQFFVQDNEHIAAIADYADGHAPLPSIFVQIILKAMLYEQSSVSHIIE